MIEIMNLRKEKPKEPYDVRVDRASPLGNTFFMKDESQRDDVCRKYRHYFQDNVDTPKFKEELNRIKEIWYKYGRLRLFCWCAPLKCHAETIKHYLLYRYYDFD